MVESIERIVKVGFRRSPKKVFDEIEILSADMIRQGWRLRETCIEDGLGHVHLFFERELSAETISETNKEHYLRKRSESHEV